MFWKWQMRHLNIRHMYFKYLVRLAGANNVNHTKLLKEQSNLGPHCLPFRHHQQVVKWRCLNYRISMINLNILCTYWFYECSVVDKKKCPLYFLTDHNFFIFFTLLVNLAGDKLIIVFLFFQDYRIWHFVQIVSIGENMHEMSKPVFWGNILKCRLLKSYPKH